MMDQMMSMSQFEKDQHCSARLATTPQEVHLSDIYTTSDLYCSCYGKNNFEPASKSKNKQEQVDKRTEHKSFPKNESDIHKFGF